MASSSPHPDTHQDTPPDFTPVVSSTSSTSTSPSPPAVTMAGATAASPQKSSHQQGQPFEPLDKAASQTVKLNPKLELSRNDLLRLLSYMEGELQSRDVVIATLKTERVKNLLQYGRVGLSDPFLALQRDSIGGSVVRGGGVNEAELRALEETQLAQLEHLIAQQRKAHQRMRHVLREAEKRHSRVVAELEEERRKHEHDTAQGDDVTYALEKDRTRLKQPELRILKELEAEKAAKKKVEKELRKVQETLEEERGRQKQIILMLVEERKRLALQYVEERKRSEDLAQILSEEKGRIDSMAEGLEEESKKSLQMEAELEKQLADFDTERQQMRGQLTKKEERISELEALLEKQQREVDHYKKQLQEAHNVAMFQQTLSVSPPRIGIATRPAPPQLPAKPATLTQPQPRMPGLDEVTGVPLNMGLSVAPHHVSSGPGATNPSHSVPPGVAAMSSVTKAVQLTATVNSVPVAGPTTGIARGVQPGVGLRPVMYSVSTSEVTRTVTTAAKSYSVSENEAGWTGGSEGEVPGSLAGGVPGAVERGVVRVTGPAGEARSQAQVVQVTPRVNVSASPGTKVITTTHGGKVTFHVTTNAPTTTAAPAPPASNGQQQQTLTQTSTMIKKPPPPTRSTQPGGPPPPVPLNKPTAAPPVPPNKPAVPPKKDLVTRVGAGGQGVSVEPGTPISVEVKPQKVGPQTVKFGITISKTAASGGGGQPAGSGGGGGQAVVGVGSGGSGGGSETPVAPSVEGGAVSPRRDAAQVGGGGPPVHATACVDSLSPELEHFHQLLISMAGSSDVAVPAISNLTSPSNPSSAPNTHVVCSSPSQSPCASLPSVSPSGPSSTHLPSLSPLPHHSISLNTDHEGHASLSSPIAIPLSSPPPLPAYSSLSSPSSVAAASVSLSQSLLYPPLHSPLPASPASRLSESTPQSSASLGATPWMPSSLSPSSTIINTPTATTTTNTTTTLNYHHHSPIATSITSNTVTTSSTTTTTTSSLSGSLPPPLPLGDCPVVLTPMEGEDLEPPHSPLDVSTPLTMDGMTALHIAAQGNNWQSVPVLVRCGGSVSAEDDEGRTPAYLALLYACTPAAAALLAFPQSLEHTTKDGCNYLHAAIKSAEAECVEVLLQHILATDDGPHLLHWLASGPDHRGSTPLALAVAHPTADLLAALCHAGLDLPALLSHDPSLLKLASPACHALFSTSSQSESTCSVWLEGLDLDRVTNGDGGCSHKQEDEFESGSGSSSSNEYRERWPIGAVRVTTTTLWAVLEEALTSLALHHLDTLARSHGPSSVSMGGRHSSGSGSRGERRRSDPLQELEVNSPHLGITKAAISHFSIGHHRWTRGEYGLVSGPCDLLANTGSQDICIHLRTFEAAAYSLLVPVPVLKNYLRLMEQSQCVVVYGPRDSGKCSLVRCLAHLKGSGSGVGVTRIDLARGRAASLESVRGVAESGGNLVLEHVSREAWPAVWAMMQGISGGTVLVTMDAWRRPGGGQLEGGVLWVQLRHDREPLVSTLSRSLMRLLASQHSGVLPSPASHTQRIVEWVTAAWSRLAATLMSLGFSSALHGPHLFTQALCGAVSPRDILRGVKHLWNSVISSEIRTEVVSVWRRSSVGGEVDEARVTSMALYVVIQRSLAPGLPLPPPQAHDFLASLDGGLGRSAFRGIKSSVPSSRPKDLPLDVIGSPLWTGSSQQVAEIPQQSGPPVGLSSPTSPEWDEANLTKILGLSPMGYT
ncbi:cortactin-binding protein 2-like isoform X4 [Eriocheir sinensis]|uniref:cortactin-binding protein 2-like isoform X4 n=1 Tax=Eriocheir sinensis TaxID=95602 RepID=UPI0021C5CFD1|nr:cortactin-binding protein 2-like isoform X4 [Eriocheir sinensis]